MIINISNRQRSSIVGILILVAYSMLTYVITKNITLGVITDIISGLAVIGIPLLLFPIFNTNGHKVLNLVYLESRLIEGILMIIGGVIILNPELEGYRKIIYETIHLYFFIAGALFFYILLYRTLAVPMFISIWGFIATIILIIVTIIKLFGFNSSILNAFLIPMILNEFFLAVWLIIKGFNLKTIEEKQRMHNNLYS